MRKVLLRGAAFAATCISAVAVPAGGPAAAAEPSPEPSVSGRPTPSLTSSEDTGTESLRSPTPGTTRTGGSASPSASSSTSSPGRAAPGGGATDGVVSAKAVMVTPRPPKFATYAYGRGPRQRIDAYWRPVTRTAKTTSAAKTKDRTATRTPVAPTAKPKPGPAILVLHGGYWLEGDKSGWKYFARRLTAQGFTVFAADYRLATMAAWPAQRNDTLNALAFIKKHAAQWNVDPNRIVIMGSSAGGMLATQAGTYGTGGQRVRGVIALSPVNTPYLAYQDGMKATATGGQRKLRQAVIDLIRCTPSQLDPACWKRVDDANSASHASPGDAPMLLMHSTGDFVPVTHSTGLAAALRAVNVPVTVKTVPGTMHGPALMNDEHVYPEILSWLKAHTR